MTELQRRKMYESEIPALSKQYDERETASYIWYRTATGEKYRINKNTHSWSIVTGNLVTFTKFLEQNLCNLNIV